MSLQDQIKKMESKVTVEEESPGYRVAVAFNTREEAERFIKLLDFLAGFVDESTIQAMAAGQFTGSYNGTPEIIEEG